jgi:hypothetical protein
MTPVRSLLTLTVPSSLNRSRLKPETQRPDGLLTSTATEQVLLGGKVWSWSMGRVGDGRRSVPSSLAGDCYRPDGLPASSQTAHRTTLAAESNRLHRDLGDLIA